MHLLYFCYSVPFIDDTIRVKRVYFLRIVLNYVSCRYWAIKVQGQTPFLHIFYLAHYVHNFVHKLNFVHIINHYVQNVAIEITMDCFLKNLITNRLLNYFCMFIFQIHVYEYTVHLSTLKIQVRFWSSSLEHLKRKNVEFRTSIHSQ